MPFIEDDFYTLSLKIRDLDFYRDTLTVRMWDKRGIINIEWTGLHPCHVLSLISLFWKTWNYICWTNDNWYVVWGWRSCKHFAGSKPVLNHLQMISDRWSYDQRILIQNVLKLANNLKSLMRNDQRNNSKIFIKKNVINRYSSHFCVWAARSSNVCISSLVLVSLN